MPISMPISTPLSRILLSTAIGFTLAAPAVLAGSLQDLGKSITYPVKKGAQNAGKTVTEGAGHASKGINHTGQAAAYPLRKTGENTSKTTHKTVSKVTGH